MGETKQRERSNVVKRVDLKEYKGKTTASSDNHNRLSEMINLSICINASMINENIAGDRATVIISTPKKWGASVSSHPGHCGIVLWNYNSRRHQSLGIYDDGTFGFEAVNVGGTKKIKKDDDFNLWYFTKVINLGAYDRMRARMYDLYQKQVDYGKFFIFRGVKEDGSYNCVTAVDTILVAGGLSKGIASLTSAPYAYAQTFTAPSWYIS